MSNNMTLAHLNAGTDNYTLNLTNEEMEDKLEPDQQYSTAGDFRVILNPSVDLSGLLYLKSVQAELCVRSISLDNLPLSASRLEKVRVYVTTPPSSAAFNQVLNRASAAQRNEVPLVIKMVDISTDDPQEMVDTLNQMIFHEKVSSFVISKYLALVFDQDIFKPKELTTFNKSDANLILRYLNISLFVRHVAHDTMKELLDRSILDEEQRRDPALTEDLRGRWKYEEATQGIITRAGEREALAKSENLKLLNERIEVRDSWIKFEDFYGETLKNATATLKTDVGTHILEQLVMQEIATEGNVQQAPIIPPETLKDAMEMFSSNRILIEYALLARNMMDLQQNLHDKRRNPEVLFEKRIISLVLDKTKSKICFHFAKQNFLPSDGTSCQIILPKHLSYSLGARPGKNITLGPISLNTPEQSEPRLTENIFSDNQRLFSSVRTLPSIFHCTTDIITSKGRDILLRRSDAFADHNIIHRFQLSQEQITRRFIFEQSKEVAYHRIQNVHNILETFRICFLDECFQPIRFAPRTICNISLIIKPVTFDESL